MPTLTHTGSVQFRSSYVDGDLSLSREDSLRTDLSNGTGSRQASGYWSGTLTLAAASSQTLNLRGLESLILGVSVSTGFSTIKQITIRNASPGATLTVDQGTADGWAQITAYRVGASGIAVHYAPVDGLPTTLTSKTIRIANNTTATVRAGSTTSGSTAITGISSTSSLAVGMAISGDGIPSGATVSEITSSTSVAISAAATATGSAVSLSYQWIAAVDVFVVGVLA